MPRYSLKYKSLDDEKRYLKVHNEQLKRSLVKRIKNQQDLENELKKANREKQLQQEENEKLKAENEKLRRERDMYRKMLFKENVKSQSLPGKDKSEQTGRFVLPDKSERGAKIGHIGHGRKLPPADPDLVKRAFLTHCPNCHNPLNRTDSIDTHTVEDVPPPSLTPIQVIKYEKERQWCKSCNKEVMANHPEEIPGIRFGLNLIVYIMVLKYGAKVSLDSIVLLLEQNYSLKVSKGEIISLLHKTKKWLGNQYEQIKMAVRASPVKHADETGWRVAGINSWIWGFMTDKQVYLSVEESRGKGIPEEILKGSHPDDVLVRDDYAGYAKLPFKHQSCWAHLLRKSHEAAIDINASEEIKTLHQTLKELFGLLEISVKQSFNQKGRNLIHTQVWNTIQGIINQEYTHDDAKTIQVRIKHQGKNLLTAILHDNVPLTNNLAERSLRKIVVIRKMSGGSRSWEGAKATAVNMSVYQTIQLQNLPLIPTLKEYLLSGINHASGKL